MTVPDLISTAPDVADSTTAVAERAPLTLRRLSSTARAEALFLWRKLELELASQRLMCSSLWTETWLDHFGHWIPHEFLVAYRGPTVCGIVLLTQGVHQMAGPFTLRTCHVGTAGEPEADSVCVEYNRMLARPEDQADLRTALWNHIVHETDCDEFRMDGIESHELSQFVGVPQVRINREPCYYYDFAGLSPQDDLLARLGTNTRSRIRRTLRELGSVRHEWTDSVERSEDLFLQMVDLHQARWNAVGKPGVYASRSFRAFHLDLLRRAVPLRLMSVFAVFSNDQLIGCNQILIDDQRTLVYQCGRTPGEARVSYGVAIDYLNIEESRRRGFRAFDFLAGDTEHKRRLSNQAAELAWLTWRRPNWKNAAIDTLRSLKRASQRWAQSVRPAPRIVPTALEGESHESR